MFPRDRNTEIERDYLVFIQAIESSSSWATKSLSVSLFRSLPPISPRLIHNTVLLLAGEIMTGAVSCESHPYLSICALCSFNHSRVCQTHPLSLLPYLEERELSILSHPVSVSSECRNVSLPSLSHSSAHGCCWSQPANHGRGVVQRWRGPKSLQSSDWRLWHGNVRQHQTFSCFSPT